MPLTDQEKDDLLDLMMYNCDVPGAEFPKGLIIKPWWNRWLTRNWKVWARWKLRLFLHWVNEKL